jgi:hypothetical protein
MHEREAYYHEQQDPIEGETDREPLVTAFE